MLSGYLFIHNIDIINFYNLIAFLFPLFYLSFDNLYLAATQAVTQ